MRKQMLNKIVSILLVLAVCSATVFGCLITVNAADGPSYQITNGAASADLTTATADATFTVPNGMVDGMFTVNKTGNPSDAADCFASVTAVVKGGTPKSGTFSAEDFSVTVSTEGLEGDELALILFESADVTKLYTSITFELTFTFAKGAATKGASYAVSVAGFDFSGSSQNYNTFEGTAGVIETGCDHIITIDSSSVLIDTDKVNGYSVYSNAVCSICGERFDYQVVPNALPLDEKTIYWDGSTYTEPTTQDSEGNYIIDTAAKLAYLACKTKDNTYETYGKTYKVADGIDAIVLQPESLAAIKDKTSAAEVKAFFDKNAGAAKWWNVIGYNGQYPFQGTFDGNGATIYGIYANWASYADWHSDLYAGLFGLVDKGAVIKNVTVKNSYLTTKGGFMGAIFANTAMDSTNWNTTANMGTGDVVVENCVAANNYMNAPSTDYNNIKKYGVLVGASGYDYLKMNNCMAYGNDAKTDLVTPDSKVFDIPFIGALNGDKVDGKGVNSVTNVIALGATPYNRYAFGWGTYLHHKGDGTNTSCFENVYTDQPIGNFIMYSGASAYKNFENSNMYGLTKIDAESIKGTKAEETLVGFDFENVWAVDKNGGYPLFAKSVATINQTENIIYNDNYGASDDSFMTAAEAGVGDTPDNPYIIKTIENLVYLVRKATPTQTSGKFFKVDDNIDAIVCMSQHHVKKIGEYYSGKNDLESGLEVLKNMTVEQANEYYGADKSTDWYGGNASKEEGVFAGTIDFNGATVYGLNARNGGLFQYACAGATFKNLTINGSYAIGDAAAAIVANCNYGTGNGTITFENCTVANSVVVCQRRDGAISFGGVLAGVIGNGNIVNINNCLVYGNSAKHQGYYDTITGYDITYGLFGTAGTHDGVYSTVQNSIILDCVPHATYRNYAATQHITYSNIYTNVIGQTITNIDFYSNGTSKYRYTLTPTIDSNGKYTSNINEYDLTNNQDKGTITGEKPAGSIIAASKEDVSGVNARNIISKFDAGVWSYDGNGGYPTPLAAFADTINSVSSRDLSLKAVNLTYANSGNFSINLHYEPAYAGFNPALYVTKSDSSKFMKLSSTASSMAGNGLSNDAIMYTIPNLSARDIDDALLFTTVSANVNTAVWGKTEQISIKDYAISVISGEAVYTDGATDAQKQADKNVAAAVINYCKAANSVTSSYDGASAGTVLYWDGSTYTEPTTQDAEGNYIIDTAAKLAYLACKTKDNTYETYGKTYKVADGIDAIVLQPESLAAIKDKTSAAEVKAFFDKNAGAAKWWNVIGYNGAYPFQGTFDGNGATIYGIYANWASYADWHSDLYAGLFGLVDKGAVIKNVTVKNSYLTTKGGFMGAIFANTAMDSTNWNTTANMGTGDVVVENCVAANNYMNAPSTDYNNIKKYGVLVGASGYDYLKMNNCMAYGNDAKTDLVTPDSKVFDIPFIGALNGDKVDGKGVNSVTNVIALGATPYNRYAFGWGTYLHHKGDGTNTSCFENVYTDQPIGNFTMYNGSKPYTNFASSNMYGLTKVDAESIKGVNAKANCPNLDWNIWAYGSSGNYPTFATADINALFNTGKTLYWDGSTYTEPTDDDGDGVYIIDTAAKLAYLACKTKDNTYETYGKTFKVADGIKSIVLQPESLAAIKDKTSAAEVKAFFDENATSAKWWNVIGYQGKYPFQGTFDGNGATIYGIYANWASYADWHSDLYAGLFGLVDKGAVIKNVTVKNSYLTTKNGFMGAIFANTAMNSATWNVTENMGTGDVVVENCVAANNYMNAPTENYNNRTKFGVLLGAADYDYLKMNNCMAYGNDAKTDIVTPDSQTFDIPFIGALNGDKVDGKGVNSVANVISLGATPYNRYNFGYGSYVHHEGNNTGTNCFKNVYTDQPIGNFIMYNNQNQYLDFASKAMPNLTSVTANDLKGDKGAAIVEALNTANGTTVWYTGWGYPGFKEAGIMPDANQSAYDNFSLSNYDIYTATDPEFSMYGTSLSLKANPYIGFTFAFHGDYKANRDKITVTFKNAAGTVIKQTTVADANGNLNAGWTNNKNAGRYHLYKLTDVDAKDLCSPITVIVNYNGTDYEFGKFSAEGFALDAANAYSKVPCTYYSTRYEAAKALLFYTKMLDARYGAA